MAKSYTQDDLILFIYNELPEEDKINIQKTLDSNPEFLRSFQMLQQVAGSLDTVNYEPHPTSIEIILEYSQHEAEHFH